MKNKFKAFLILLLVGGILLALSFALSSDAKWTVRVVSVLFLLGAIAVLLIKDKAPEPISEEYHYRAKKTLMSAPERELYYILLTELGRAYDIFPQVALASIVDKTTYASNRNELFRVVDFLLCARKTNRPLLVIELNDATHNRDERKLRDEKVKCILSRAGIPLLTLTLADLSDERAIRLKVKSLL